VGAHHPDEVRPEPRPGWHVVAVQAEVVMGTGEKAVTIVTAGKIAGALGTTLEDLFMELRQCRSASGP
jgi:hypothetical protein